jgi:fucose 4-O-acetylase-like acetyltransferase
MNRYISQKIRFFTFLAVVLLGYVHGYNLNESYLLPYTVVNEPIRITTFTEYLFANGLLRFRIPLLFIISGYIYAMQDNRPYWEQTKKRVRTLLVPYLIWSAVGLLITFIWQQFPITMEVLQKVKLDQMGDNRPYTDIGWGGVIVRWLISPIAFHLWFILFLFIYNLAYPLLKWVIVKYPAIWLTVTGILWITNFQYWFIHGLGLFFFSVGVWINKKNIIIDRKPKWYSHYLAWLIFIGFSVIKTFMAFEVELNYTTGTIMSLLYAGSTLAGLMAFWFGADALVKWCVQQKWFLWGTSFSFIIYALHNPLVIYVTHILLLLMGSFPLARLSCYVFVPFLIVLFCIATGALLRRLVPGFYKLASGSRGLT